MQQSSSVYLILLPGSTKKHFYHTLLDHQGEALVAQGRIKLIWVFFLSVISLYFITFHLCIFTFQGTLLMDANSFRQELRCVHDLPYSKLLASEVLLGESKLINFLFESSVGKAFIF